MNIFYTQVDTNLQKELNARARSGYDRTVGALNFMLGKYANIELSAYDGPGPAVDESNLVHVLGGAKSWGPEYAAGGQDGFLNPEKSTTVPSGIEWNWNPKEKKVWASQATTTIGNLQLRIPPYISSADIQIGDNSMGLLNTANVVIEIPNAQRDLDLMEEVYMRPGRYAKLKFIHDESTLASFSETRGLLSGSIPTDSKLKELYPNVNLEEKKNEIRRMNQITFEGLITNFDFSYQKDFSVQLQIQLRGTSNVFTDVSMFIDAQGNAPTTGTVDPIADPAKYKQTINFSEQTDVQQGKIDTKDPKDSKDIQKLQEITITATRTNKTERKSFYGQLYQQVEADYQKSFEQTNQISYIEYFDLKTQKTLKLHLNRLDKKPDTKHTDQFFLCGDAWGQCTAETEMATFYRYITLGYLIDFINNKVLRDISGQNKGKVTNNAQIVCSDKLCFSNYYPEMCSIDPINILLLPADSKRGTTETYGSKTTKLPTSPIPTFEKRSFYKDTPSSNNQWPGFTGNSSEPLDRTYPSRIFINLELINEILKDLQASNSASFKVSDFLSMISLEILKATSGAISLKLITHPEDQSVLAFYDENFIGTPANKKGVKEYTIPMTTSGSGTIVHEFQLKASLPENVSSLSYVLNQDPERITTEDIAPYINYMYNSTDPTKKTQAEQTYAKKHNEFKDTLTAAKIKFGESMTDATLRDALDKAQKAYFQYPTPDIKTSVQLIAPIIPFDISFTIDGIQGFRYGDVLTFDVLPTKYRVNTVFSIISVTHQVTQDSTWTTEVKCIMRPKVEA